MRSYDPVTFYPLTVFPFRVKSILHFYSLHILSFVSLPQSKEEGVRWKTVLGGKELCQRGLGANSYRTQDAYPSTSHHNCSHTCLIHSPYSPLSASVPSRRIERMDVRLNSRISDGAEYPLTIPIMNFNILPTSFQQLLDALLNLFPHAQGRQTTFLDDSRLECKLQVSRILIQRRDPTVAYQQTFEGKG